MTGDRRAGEVAENKLKRKNMITLIIGIIIGFVAGVLVTRNNKAKVEKVVQRGEQVADKGKDVIRNFRK